MSASADAELGLILDAALAAGLLVHRTGGDTARTVGTMSRVALSLGAEQVEPVVSSMNVGLTLGRGERTVTALRKAAHLGVDLAALATVEQAVRELEAGRLGRPALRAVLTELAQGSQPYPLWLRVGGIGVAGGCFAALFDGDGWAIAASGLASGAGLAVRLTLLGHAFRPFVATLAAAAMATALAAVAVQGSQRPEAAISASVLFLIPGVPLVNGTSDLLDGSPLNGVVRLAAASVTVLALVLGMGLALRVVHVAGLP